MEGDAPFGYQYRIIRLDFVTTNLVVILDYTIIILGEMSMCKVVVNEVCQFSGRINGYELYDMKSGEVIGMAEKDIIKALKAGEKIHGFILSKSGTLELDAKGFYQTNIMVKTTLTSMHPKVESPVNILYTVVGKKGEQYTVINSRFGKSEVSKNKLSAMLEIGMIQGGCKLEKNEIILAEGI